MQTFIIVVATERLVTLNAVQLLRGSCDRTADHRGRDAVVVWHRGCWITMYLSLSWIGVSVEVNDGTTEKIILYVGRLRS